MQVTDYFRVTNDGKVALNSYKLVIRKYLTLDKTQYEDSILYLTDDEAKEIRENIVPKHQLFELIADEPIDTSKYAWMDGIELCTADYWREITRIAAYGSMAAYMASLDEARDEYLLDLDCRISAVELGI